MTWVEKRLTPAVKKLHRKIGLVLNNPLYRHGWHTQVKVPKRNSSKYEIKRLPRHVLKFIHVTLTIDSKVTMDFEVPDEPESLPDAQRLGYMCGGSSGDVSIFRVQRPQAQIARPGGWSQTSRKGG